jgi:hypothetical protein
MSNVLTSQSEKNPWAKATHATLLASPSGIFESNNQASPGTVSVPGLLSPSLNGSFKYGLDRARHY